MKPGDRVRWAEAHCRLESLKAKSPEGREALREHLEAQEGVCVGSGRIGNQEVVSVAWSGPFEHYGAHVLPAELLERAGP